MRSGLWRRRSFDAADCSCDRGGAAGGDRSGPCRGVEGWRAGAFDWRGIRLACWITEFGGVQLWDGEGGFDLRDRIDDEDLHGVDSFADGGAGEGKFDEPVRELLPPGTVANLRARRLRCWICDAHSGLPRMPDNFHPVDGRIRMRTIVRRISMRFIKSMAWRSRRRRAFCIATWDLDCWERRSRSVRGRRIQSCLKEQVPGPLGLTRPPLRCRLSSRVALFRAFRRSSSGACLDLDAFAGAGAIRSTASDMLKYLAANLHPETVQVYEIVTGCKDDLGRSGPGP